MADSKWVAIVGACNYELQFDRIIVVLGPFDSKAEAHAAGDAETGKHETLPDSDCESSIEFDVHELTAPAAPEAASG